jgi:hypothetical protein
MFCFLVDGKWSVWTDWSPCPVTCGGGTIHRMRTCDSPPPGPYGLNCTGTSDESMDCNLDACPGKYYCDNLYEHISDNTMFTLVNGSIMIY